MLYLVEWLLGDKWCYAGEEWCLEEATALQQKIEYGSKYAARIVRLEVVKS